MQSLKASLPISLRLSGRITLVRDLQPEKAPMRISVRPLWGITLVRDLQPIKAYASITPTYRPLLLPEKVTTFRDSQSLKVSSPISIRLPGKVTLVRDLQPIKARLLIQPPRPGLLLPEKVTTSKDWQSLKASSPIPRE
ncbi:hypothetical protein Barb7_03065 [Bacteroidales bacterium Barb7]|nr:hypothetical protein Barb7_03065 [Bacteroidales bacterium Barb7]